MTHDEQPAAALALIERLPAQAPVGFALLDPDLRILAGSPSLARLLGADGADLTGRPLAALLPAEAAGPIAELAAEILADERPRELDLGTGSETHWLIVARHLGPGPACLGLTISDVTERGRAALELRESERQLAAAQRIARMGWWVAQVDPVQIHYSPALAAIFGLGPRDAAAPIAEPDWRDRVAPEDRERVYAEVRTAMRERRPMHLHLRARRSDGVPLRLEIRATPVTDASGTVVGLQGLTQDVTSIERAGRLQRAVAELGHLGLEGGGLEGLVERACHLVEDTLDVESATVERPGGRASVPADTAAELRCAIRGPDGLHGTLVAATRAPRRFAEEEVAFMESVAHVLGQSIARRAAMEEIAALSAARGLLVAQALDAEARARRGISERLHDGPLQDLLAAGHDLYGLGDGPDAAAAQERLRAIARDLREVMVALHPTVLRYGGLQAALHAVAGQRARAAGLRVDVSVDVEATGVHDELLLSLGRELVADAARHTGASAISVAVRRVGAEIELEIAQDGRPEPGRVALATVGERVTAVGGHLDVLPGQAGGTRTVVRLPVP